ncbi:Ger(x)C family spore germination protein [Paenibacillus arenilitoris]|uniref:Ger(X)C family spore germination protein n=1 Tax=Paenibacillus arenilitoris TaxID=2772299 RepID=A0A927H8C5_9BACL|nr:Ger(x)C family spore germination protein [Paenibacillus arenilitoris]MBD2871427.1 Ger(x)C family spore germination protein [Paenibacillus arenilitoris]
MSIGKLFKLFLAIVLALPAGGCWNRVELNEIGIVSATGVDLKEGKWQISYQVVIPQAISGNVGTPSSAAAVNVFSTTGDSFRSAISRASQETSRRLYFAHNQIVIISQEAARSGLEQLFDVYLRNADSRETVSVFLAKGSARRMLEQLIPLEKIPGAAIQRMIANEEANSSVFREMTMHDVLFDLLGASQATGIPSLTVAGSSESLDQADKLSRTNTPSKVRLNDLGLIDKDRLVGWISKSESRGVMWLAGHIKRATVAFSCREDDKGLKESSVLVTRAKTKLRPEKSGGKWVMHVAVDAEGTLMEYNCEGDLTKPGDVGKVEKAIEEEIKREMELGWQAVRKHKTDVVGFGGSIRQNDSKAWKSMKDDWPEEFSRMDARLSVRMKVGTTGMSGSGFKKTQKKARS